MAEIDNSVRSSSKNQPIGQTTGVGSTGIIISGVQVKGGQSKNGGSAGQVEFRVGDDNSSTFSLAQGANYAPVTLGLGDAPAESALSAAPTPQAGVARAGGDWLQSAASALGVSKQHFIIGLVIVGVLLLWRKF